MNDSEQNSSPFAEISLGQGVVLLEQEIRSLVQAIKVFFAQGLMQEELLYFSLCVFSAQDLQDYGKEKLINLLVEHDYIPPSSDMFFREELATGLFYVYFDFRN